MQMNIWNIKYLNCGERYEDMIDHCIFYTQLLAVVKLKPEKKNSGRNFLSALISQLLKLCV